MIVLLIVMVISGGVLSVIAGIATLIANSSKTDYKPPVLTPVTEVHQHVDVHVQEQPKWPTIAEQFDGRLTNVFKNPLECIL